MKLQTLEFPYGEITFTRDGELNLTEMVKQMNQWRRENGLGDKNLSQLLATDGAKSFANVVCKELGIKSAWRGVRGKNAATYASLHMAIWVAEQYSDYFHFLVIDRFITQRQVELRNIGAVSFVELNAAISRMIERTEGRLGHSGHFINAAKMIKGAIDIRDVTGFDTWDSQDAVTNELRSEIQKSLVTLLDMEAVDSWEIFKETIPRVVRKCAKKVKP